MSSNTARAEDARLRGNAFYKALQFNKAIVAYKVAAALVPSDPTPLSNLSAATFELGDYEKSIQFSNQALALLEKEADTDPRKQKLIIRLSKARRYQSDPDNSIAKESLWNAIFRLPRYRPNLTNDRSYYPSGHDTPESLYGRTLRRTTKKAPVVSFMFCGIGDARNLLQTMMDYHLNGPSSHQSDQRLHLTILDFKPAILARDLILFLLLDDISLNLGISNQKKYMLGKQRACNLTELLTTVSYFYITQVMPAYALKNIQAIIQRLLDAFDDSRQPISWVHIPVAVQAAVRPSLESWKRGPFGPYSTQRFREIVQGNSKSKMNTTSMVGGFDLDSFSIFSYLKFDKRVYDDFTVLLPPEDMLNEHDPALAQILRDYKQINVASVTMERISSHINRKWKPNLTLADIVFENENSRPGTLPSPEMGFTPFEVMQNLLMGSADFQGSSSIVNKTLMSVSESYFQKVASAIASLRDRMIVEVCLGEMADFLEKMQHQTLDRSREIESKDCSSSPEWPQKYHIIHMSNIPLRHLTEIITSDYVGGPLTSFLYGVPILEHGPGTGLTSRILRNPLPFDDVSTYFSEYLLMYNPKLVRSHFHLALSCETPAAEDLMSYLMWERIPKPQQLLNFEQLMSQSKFSRWIYAHFLKICLPYPRMFPDRVPLAPLNMTAFIRLIMYVSGLGYPAHWISNLMDSILSGKITTNARPPSQIVCTPRDVDAVYPTQSFSTTSWILEFATLTGLWRRLLPVGLVLPSTVPQVEEIVQYHLKFPGFKVWDARVPHSMLVFYNEEKVERLPKNLRPILMEDIKKSDPKSRVLQENVRCMSTFDWSVEDQEVTFWISNLAFEEMKDWNVEIWRIDVWEKESNQVKLADSVVKKKSWEEWKDSPSFNDT
ncbi:uncharacterized protein MELLADRAFT_65695 [Melampsora larici-populina 98AG31]|uniref:DUF4470 domain-containing protein n=1 Tax=Melampsora larici-populina (strain 98AG31 / pathotype 3-4-7) TaxID=747676 RepID=F4RWD6_MELLP|nr:uncharacterized protein MELLADRAFT_65695 [Melampsora larici-populina 98AG31]EGG03340.1 hypothetical protein MELLADRAFT_65695 [Melampsora larici-populina 98AG31]